MNLYVYPYYMTAKSNLYFDIKGELTDVKSETTKPNTETIN